MHIRGVASVIHESFISELLYFIQFVKVSHYTVYFHTLCLLSQSHTHYLAGSLTHSSAAHSLTRSLTALTHSPPHPLTHPLTHSQVRDVILSSTSVGARHRDHLVTGNVAGAVGDALVEHFFGVDKKGKLSLAGHTYFAWGRIGGARKGKGEGEKYVWCKRTGFCALTPECWRHQSDCS